MEYYQSHPSVQNRGVEQVGVQYVTNPGAEYGNHIKNTAAFCMTSSSHTYGNVASIVKQFLIDQFPEDTFNTITISTTLANKQLLHTPTQLSKLKAPLMVISPRIDFGQDDDRFLGHTLMNDRITNQYNLWGDGSLIPLAYDKYHKIHIHGHYNRAVMYFDIVLSFNTFIEQTNWMSYIHNMLPINHNQFIKAPLELFIPDEFNNLLSDLSGVPIETQNDQSVYEFMKYMNSIWMHPITYKLKGSSNNNQFFMYYISDIDYLIKDPTPNPGMKDGQIHRGFDITFTMRCEFNTIGYFMLNSPVIKKVVHINPKTDRAIVPIFTDRFNFDDFQLPVGWSILGFPVFKLDKGEDHISIDNILNKSIRTVIDYHLKYNIPISRFLKFQFRENDQILHHEHFSIDWKNRVLTLMHPDYQKTYRLLITVSYDYINNLIKELYNLE